MPGPLHDMPSHSSRPSTSKRGMPKIVWNQGSVASDLLGDKLAKRRLQTLTCSSLIGSACHCLTKFGPSVTRGEDYAWNRDRSGVSTAMKPSQVPEIPPQEHHLLNPSNVYIHVYHHTSLETSPDNRSFPLRGQKLCFQTCLQKNPAPFAECPPLLSNISEPLLSNAEKNIPILPTLTHLAPSLPFPRLRNQSRFKSYRNTTQTLRKEMKRAKKKRNKTNLSTTSPPPSMPTPSLSGEQRKRKDEKKKDLPPLNSAGAQNERKRPRVTEKPKHS